MGLTTIFCTRQLGGQIAPSNSILEQFNIINSINTTGNYTNLEDILGYLGTLNMYWWKRRTKETIVNFSIPSGSSNYDYRQLNTTYTIAYSPTLEINSSGKVVLQNPTVYDLDTSNISNACYAVRGNFWSIKNKGAPNPVWTPVYVSTPDAQVVINSGNYNVRADNASNHYSTTTNWGDWEYVQSTSSSTYPHSGKQDGYEYVFLGSPFQNIINGAQIEVGSYTGTGTYGSSNPNSLTFSFSPKLLVISGSSSNQYVGILAKNAGFMISLPPEGAGDYTRGVNMSLSENTISWYSIAPEYQLNLSGVSYQYFAIG